MPHIELRYTDRSGTTHPCAAVFVTSGRVQLNPNTAEFRLTLYHDAAAQVSALDPFEVRDPVPFTPAEVASLIDQFALAVYQVLQARPEFAGSSLVP